MSEQQASDLPQTASPTAPPLGIGHLLLWMACSAVLLTASLSFNRIIFESQEAFMGNLIGDEEIALFDSARSIIDGPALAGLFIWWARKRRGLRFPVQPGEWLLMLMGIASLLFVATLAIWSRMPVGGYPRILLLPLALLVSGFLFVALRPPLPKWWRVGLLTLTALYGIDFVQNLVYTFFLQASSSLLLQSLTYIYLLSCIISIVVLLICLMIDRVKHIKRGWLHWTGLGTCIGSLLLTIGRVVYFEWFLV